MLQKGDNEFEIADNKILLPTKSKKIQKEKKDKKEKKHKRERKEQNTLYSNTIRNFTLSMVVPSSIIDNAQSMELKTYLVGQIAKAATIFSIQEIVIISDDKSKQMKMMQDLTTTEFFVQNLEYLESP
jgi:high-affinity Fe2+/Pb2+ permease